MKKTIYRWLNPAADGDKISKFFDIFIMTLIGVNILAVMIETVEPIAKQYSLVFYYFEVFSVLVFSLEYVFRVWSCTCDKKYKHPLWGRLRYMITPMALIDLLAIVPFYLPLLIKTDLRFIRSLRMFRLFRMLKFGRYNSSIQLLGSVIKSKKEELLIMLFSILVMLVLSSSVMYYVENEAQPEAFSSIPEALWWGTATLTTVGYGDVFPITPLGKFLAAIMVILGIGFFALPTGVLAAAFSEKIERKYRHDKCPHCGKELK